MDRANGTAALPPAAARLRKPSWRDPRLLLGILLVLGSIAGVITLVDSVDKTTDVYAVQHDIPPGSPIRGEDLVAVPVRLGGAEQHYLTVTAGVPAGAVAGTVLREGELVARSALAGPGSLNRKPVGLRMDDPLPASTDAGTRVDIWAAMPSTGNGFDEPKQLIEAAEISELTVSESALGANRSTELLVLVENPDLPLLLSALSNQAKITVVSNPSPGT